jgi:enoyl-[acyl-carrier protein] reductase II
MFEGDLINGELEIGQVSSRINNINSAKDVIEDTMSELRELTKVRMLHLLNEL